MNKFVIIGKLADKSILQTDAGMSILNCRFEIERKKRTGETERVPIPAKAFKIQAESLEQRLVVGQEYCVVGSLSGRQYQDKYYIDCLIDEVYVKPVVPAVQPQASPDTPDDDLPF